MNRAVQVFRAMIVLVLAGALASCSGGAQTVGIPSLPPSDPTAAPHAPGEVVVRVMPNADRAAVASSVGGSIVAEIPRIDVLLLRLSGGRSIVDAIRTLQGRVDVLYAEPNYLAFVPEDGRPTPEPRGQLPSLNPEPGIRFVPNDPAYPAKLWGLVKIGAATAWDTTTGAANVVVAVLDTGAEAAHPDLTGKVLAGANCLTGTCTPGGTADGNGHGTHVSGTTAALGNNGTGIVGVAFNAATQILPVKVLSDVGSGSFAGIAAGIIWAADTINGMGKRGVLNMSLGGSGYSQALQDAVAYANGVGGGAILVVVAMGNEFKRFATTYPAALTGVMAVGATDGNDNRVDFSNPGPHISVSAPGRDVYSTIPGATYAYFSGTSMASPHVAGLAALVWSANPTFTNYQVRRKIEVSATDLGSPGWDESFGWGRISAPPAVTGGAPAPFYGCALITAQTAGPTLQAGADVVLTLGGMRRTTKTAAGPPGANGVAIFDFLPSGTYAVTASKIIGGTGNSGAGSVLVPATGPTSCGSTTITMAP